MTLADSSFSQTEFTHVNKRKITSSACEGPIKETTSIKCSPNNRLITTDSLSCVSG